ncbi:MAG: MFS transporter [Chloroflexota bacterium]|nr:MFS transporter [Dehalococcoidia bacterium]MDW8252332.1 MFS transporter [Chloroflexota bacterium]
MPNVLAERAERAGRVLHTASPFRVLRHRNFRLLWIGTLVSNSGDWMDQIALNWLVLTMTGSPVYLGVLNLCRSGPILLFTLFGGAAADRFERRRLMMITQSGAMLTAIGLGVVALGHGSVGLVLALAALRGVLMSVNLPARQALISELVPREELTAAISLNSATLNISRVLGPSLGGVLIATIGIAGAFFLNAATFIAVLYGLYEMRGLARPAQREEPVLRSVLEGLAFIRQDRILRSLLVVALAPLALGMSYQPMLAVFAKEVLDVGSVGLGVMMSAAGLGAVVGALGVGTIAGGIRRGRLMFAGMALFGVALVVFALSSALWLSALALLAVGIGSAVYQALNNTLIQVHAPDALRGRVMSMLFLTRGLVPLGAMLAGVGAATIGAPTTMALFGALIVVLTAVALLAGTPVRELP